MPKAKPTLKFKQALVVLNLDGEDGNAFVVLGTAGRAMLDAGMSAWDVCVMKDAALATHSYEEFLTVVQEHAPVEYVRRGNFYMPQKFGTI